MPIEIIIATVFFTLALILYSTAIWSGRQAPQLKLWQIIVFFLGVSSDALGVWITIRFIGAIVLTPHAIFGFAALILMSLHFLWVLFIFINKQQQAIATHRFGFFVWSVWLLSYLSGFVTGLQKVL
ncbi:MAG: TIGR03987 family protein [Gammaproteobacteria bacterium]|nr:TIGR03987 family protein [Gammaproteobacteria bacterium]MBQ0841151.1 TIGR03987 family protein [Gammaproteobacteria bacterium]